MVWVPVVSLRTLIDESIAILTHSMNRSDWVGPARYAYDDVLDEFRQRLRSLSYSVGSSG